MKKIKYPSLLVIILILLILLMSTSCTGVGTEESATETDTAAETSEAEVKGDKYDINDFVGLYGNGRGGIDIQAGKNNNMTVEIHWASSAAEWSEWTMHGTFNTETATLEYSDAVKVESIVDDNGNIESKETYSKGKGRFIFKRENNQSSLIWEDEMEDAGKDSDWIRTEPLNKEEVLGRWAEPRGNGSVVDVNEDGTLNVYYPDWENNGELVHHADGTWSIEGQEFCTTINGEELRYHFDEEAYPGGLIEDDSPQYLVRPGE